MKRQLDNPSLFQFLTEELNLPCISYNTTLVRVFNALPSEDKIDVYLDDDLLAKELSYKQFSYYVPVLEADIHNIKVFVSGASGEPILDTPVKIHQSNIETLAIVGTIQNPSVINVVGEPTQPSYHNKALVRYANLSQNNLNINVLLNDNIIQSGPLSINEYTSYSLLNPIMYTFQFALNDNSNNNFQTSATHILKPTRIYTFYLVGSLDTKSQTHLNYPLELVISVDLTTLIKKCPEDMKRL